MGTFLVSLGTSLVVSVFTFILGLKAGKYQTDRSKLQNLYKQLYKYFNELQLSIENNRSKAWDDFKLKSVGGKPRYVPTIKEYELSGDLIVLNNSIVDESKALEVDAMNYGSFIKKNSDKIHQAIIDNLSLYKDGFRFEDYGRPREAKNHFKSYNPNDCRSFRSFSYYGLFDTTSLKNIISSWGNDNDYALEISGSLATGRHSITLYPDCLAVSHEQYAASLIEAFNAIEGYSQIDQEKQRLIDELERVKDKIAKRAKEPYTFWETVIGAFADLFK